MDAKKAKKANANWPASNPPVSCRESLVLVLVLLLLLLMLSIVEDTVTRN